MSNRLFKTELSFILYIFPLLRWRAEEKTLGKLLESSDRQFSDILRCVQYECGNSHIDREEFCDGHNLNVTTVTVVAVSQHCATSDHTALSKDLG